MSEKKLTERQQKILNLIKESPTITGKQMSETLSVSQRTIERDISALQKPSVLFSFQYDCMSDHELQRIRGILNEGKAEFATKA